jgi:hypothetical protein
MSRQNPHITATVDGTLTGTKTYHVKVKLDAMELWADQFTAPIDFVVQGEELSPMSGMVVENGDYVLRYRFNNRDCESKLRVVDGRFMAAT